MLFTLLALGFLRAATPSEMVVRILSVQTVSCVCHDGVAFRNVDGPRGCQIRFISEGEMWQTEAVHENTSLDGRFCNLKRGSRLKMNSEITKKLPENEYRVYPTCAKGPLPVCRSSAGERQQRLQLGFIDELPSPFSLSWAMYSMLHPVF